MSNPLIDVKSALYGTLNISAVDVTATVQDMFDKQYTQSPNNFLFPLENVGPALFNIADPDPGSVNTLTILYQVAPPDGRVLMRGARDGDNLVLTAGPFSPIQVTQAIYASNSMGLDVTDKLNAYFGDPSNSLVLTIGSQQFWDALTNGINPDPGSTKSFSVSYTVPLFGAYCFCGSDGQSFTGPDPAPVKKVNTFHEGSGKVTISVFSRQSFYAWERFLDFGVTVDQDMVCVGGGGIGDNSPGGLLTASYPKEDLSAWLVSSTDHTNADRYHQAAFAIGLKIDGMTRPQLMNSISVQFADSATGEHPEAAVSVSSGYVLISGGFRVTYTGAGNMGTASFPDGPRTWKAQSKDHIDPSSATIRVYTIGLSQQLPVGSVTVQIGQQDSPQPVPQPEATANLGPGFAITGGGAEVHYSGVGSLLWKLEPTQTDSQDFTAASKDHVESDPATITSYVLGIMIG